MPLSYGLPSLRSSETWAYLGVWTCIWRMYIEDTITVRVSLTLGYSFHQIPICELTQLNNDLLFLADIHHLFLAKHK